MFLTAADTQATKLTVDDQGIVWFLEGEQMPFCSGQGINEFAEAWPAGSSVLARIVGTPENVPLVLALYHKFYANSSQVLEVCSPLCSEGADRHDPELTLYRMRGYGVAPSVGGWHQFGTQDLPSYFLAYWLHPGCGHKGPVDHAMVEQFVRLHPAWHCLAFIDHLSVEGLARVIALIIDPRWFIEPDDPDRTDKLETYLGLTSKIQAGASQGDASQRAQRCRMVMKTWNTLQVDSQADVKSPRRFLYRERGFNTNHKGDLKASRLLVEFLRQTWTNALAGPQMGRLFVPEFFFPCADEAAAFREFVCQPQG